MFFLPLILSDKAHAHLSLVINNNKGAHLLIENNPEEAKKKFLKALKKDPLNPFLHFHLGLSFELSQKKEKALKQYKTVLRLLEENQKKNKTLNTIQFKVHFNLARLYSEDQNVEKALESYQKALDLYPESKEVKTNIELLWKMAQNSKDSSKNKNDKEDNNQKEKEQNKNENKDEDKSKDKDKNQDKENPEGSDKEKEEKNNDQNEQQKQENKSKENENENKEEQNKEKQTNPRDESRDSNQERETPQKPFKSQSLTKEDVARILEEIENQEQKIRAKEYSGIERQQSYKKTW